MSFPKKATSSTPDLREQNEINERHSSHKVREKRKRPTKVLVGVTKVRRCISKGKS